MSIRRSLSALALAAAAASSASAQALDPDTVRVGRFDFGKMWTFEYAPAEYFSSTYGFDASPEWFERARLAALRIPGCSASFVSPNGLVVTNHHCARGAITSVQREGERLLDEGFYAPSLEDERPIRGTYADQLVAALDVTDEVYGKLAGVVEADRAVVRERAIDAVRARLEAEYAGADPVLVQVVPLYNGGRYSAYVIRRFRDVRLVAAAELQLGFFGGDPDNFTYPRYALDFAFYRIYDANGEPYRPTHWFTWGDGVEEGEVVFVIGNPGPTNRLQTVAQLEYQRDVLVPLRKAFFETRLQALWDAYDADPVAGERLDLRNQAFSLSNSLKAYTGRLAALRDPEIMARKAAAERALLDSIRADTALSREFGGLIGRIEALQADKRAVADAEAAFYNLAHPSYGSRVLRRAFAVLELQAATARGAAPDTVAALRDALLVVPDHPASLEEDLLALRAAELQRHLGGADPLVSETLGGRSPEGWATAFLSSSVLATQAGISQALEGDGFPESDPAMRLARALVPRVVRTESESRDLAGRERELAADLGRVRFAVYGTDVPPDATSSPRITDGVVRPYAYNGTLAPTHTTFYGLYDRHYGHQGHPDWRLPERWLPPPSGLDLATPLNFISTADTYGGNSGSPAVTKDLALVGLNFDRNVEGLSRDFIYLPERGRNIMVDVRAIREALDEVYDADRIVLEILTGRLVPSEAEADRVGR